MAARKKDKPNVTPLQVGDFNESHFESCIREFCELENIEDLRKQPQSVWNASLIYTQKHLFPTRELLRDKTPRTHSLENGKPFKQPTNCNSFNYDLLEYIAGIYIYLCYKYDKDINIMGYSLITGIEYSFLMEAARADANGKGARASAQLCFVCKNIAAFREDSLQGRLVSGKANPVGVLAILNHFYSWNMPGVTKEVKKSLTNEDLPQLKLSDNSKPSANGLQRSDKLAEKLPG